MYASGTKVVDTDTNEKLINRGDPSSADFVDTDLVTDGTWQDLDLSSIVPVGATAILLNLKVQGSAINKGIDFRKKGHSNAFNKDALYTMVTNIPHFANIWVFCGTDRVIQYQTSSFSFDILDITVCGWMIG